MAKKKKKRKVPEEVRKFLAEQLREVAVEGGKARWEGISPEERSRFMKLASAKAAEVRSAKKKAKKGKS